MALPKLGNRMRFLRQSEIRNMTIECTRAGGLNLSQGVCDTPVPEVVRRAAQAAIEEGCNIYTRFDGLPELRAAIARKLGRWNGIDVTGEGDVVVTSGSSAAFYGACLAILDPGDDVVLFEPYYGYHVDTLLSLGVEPRIVTLEPPGFSFDPAAVTKFRQRKRNAVCGTAATAGDEVAIKMTESDCSGRDHAETPARAALLGLGDPARRLADIVGLEARGLGRFVDAHLIVGEHVVKPGGRFADEIVVKPALGGDLGHERI